MRTAEERLELLHKRAEDLNRRKAGRTLSALGGLSTGLFALLLAVTLQLSGATHSTLSGQFSGASLLADSVGGYVLSAVAAFVAGVAVTVFLIRRRMKREMKERDADNPETESNKPGPGDDSL